MTFPTLKKYKITRKVCKKYCFTLFEATDRQTDAKVCLKILDEKLRTERSHAYSFLKSARLGGVLDHDSIARIFYYGKEREHYIIASESYRLKPLNLFIHENFPLTLDRVLDIVVQISQILRYAHLRGVVHGLLNPSSIFLAEDESIKIDDFGFHWLVPYLHELEDAEAIYLSYHIAPEVYKGREIDGRSDIYSLGVIFLQLLTDYVPFNYLDHFSIPNKRLNISMGTMRKLFPQYPKRVQVILARTLHQDPERRFQNLSQFEKELQELRGEYLHEMELSHLENEWLHTES